MQQQQLVQRINAERENLQAKSFLKQNELDGLVKEIWSKAETQKKIEEAYEKFNKFAKQLITNSPNEFQVKGIMYVTAISKEKFSEEAFKIYESLIMNLKKALDIVKLKMTEEHMVKDIKKAMRETSELLLLELMYKVYEVPENVLREIHDFSKTL